MKQLFPPQCVISTCACVFEWRWTISTSSKSPTNIRLGKDACVVFLHGVTLDRCNIMSSSFKKISEFNVSLFPFSACALMTAGDMAKAIVNWFGALQSVLSSVTN